MSVTYDMVAKRCGDDVSTLYVEAQVHGLEVSHYPSWECQTFNGLPEGTLGVFRSIGTLIFHKDERRWEVRVRSDATAIEVATMINTGLNVIARHGRKPGHFTRRLTFKHKVSDRTGQRIAYAGVCYQLGVDDLLGTAEAAAVQVTNELETMLLEEIGTNGSGC